MREPLRKKMEELHAEKVKLQKKIAAPLENDYDVEQLVSRVNWLFESPILLWRKADVKDKRAMMQLLFPLKLRYKRKEGFRKAPNPLKHRLMDVFEEEKSGLVVCGDHSRHCAQYVRCYPPKYSVNFKISSVMTHQNLDFAAISCY